LGCVVGGRLIGEGVRDLALASRKVHFIEAAFAGSDGRENGWVAGPTPVMAAMTMTDPDTYPGVSRC
jgi:hypothetical protein